MANAVFICFALAAILFVVSAFTPGVSPDVRLCRIGLMFFALAFIVVEALNPIPLVHK